MYVLIWTLALYGLFCCSIDPHSSPAICGTFCGINYHVSLQSNCSCLKEKCPYYGLLFYWLWRVGLDCDWSPMPALSTSQTGLVYSKLLIIRNSTSESNRRVFKSIKISSVHFYFGTKFGLWKVTLKLIFTVTRNISTIFCESKILKHLKWEYWN